MTKTTTCCSHLLFRRNRWDQDSPWTVPGQSLITIALIATWEEAVRDDFSVKQLCTIYNKSLSPRCPVRIVWQFLSIDIDQIWTLPHNILYMWFQRLRGHRIIGSQSCLDSSYSMGDFWGSSIWWLQTACLHQRFSHCHSRLGAIC